MWGFDMMGSETKVEQALSIDLRQRFAYVEPSSDIFVVKGTDGRGNDFRRLIDLMHEHGTSFYRSGSPAKGSGSEGLVGNEDIVLIKVNSQWNERGGTNTDLLKSIIEAVLAHPDGFRGEVIVADNGQAQAGAFRTGGSLDWEKNNAVDISQSVQKVVDNFSGNGKVSTYLWDKITTSRVNEYSEGDNVDGFVVHGTPDPVTGLTVSYPKFKTAFGTCVSFKNGVWDPVKKSYDKARLKLLSVPVLKVHFTYGVTGCVKHYMGVVSDKLTERTSHRSVGTGGMGTMMAETRMPDLNVLEAIWVNANPGKGPSSPYDVATRLNLVMASKDPFALDYWAAKQVLMKAASAIGNMDLASINPDNVNERAFGKWLRLSLREVEKTGAHVTIEENHMNVYVSER